MEPLPQPLFDVYTLALPRGHDFGDQPPCEAWQTWTGQACAIVTHNEPASTFGLIVMRRREDQVWSVTRVVRDLASLGDARSIAETELTSARPLEPVPSGTRIRQALYEVQGHEPSKLFRLLGQPSHHLSAWLLNQIYLALPKPDPNWAADCQTGNFHTRLWEAQLLASFREQGLFVTQPYEAPDFRIENHRGGEAWVEAVTANPKVRYEHFNAQPTSQPKDIQELFLGAAALRFAKTLGNKLQHHYERMPHVAGKPFALALADFHAPSSMVWSREALVGYLYGLVPQTVEVEGKRVVSTRDAAQFLGDTSFPVGLFRNSNLSELSAIIFTNACTLGKFNRVAASLGAVAKNQRFVRYGKFFDRAPGALDGIPFCLDVKSARYRALWPQGYEPWCAELEVFHNPFARYPLPHALLPEVTHWFEADGEMVCTSHYNTSILWSQTLIQDARCPMPTYDTIPSCLGYPADSLD